MAEAPKRGRPRKEAKNAEGVNDILERDDDGQETLGEEASAKSDFKSEREFVGGSLRDLGVLPKVEKGGLWDDPEEDEEEGEDEEEEDDETDEEDEDDEEDEEREEDEED